MSRTMTSYDPPKVTLSPEAVQELVGEIKSARAELSRIRGLLTRIAETVAEYPTITGLQAACVKDHDSIPMAIRDAQETFRDTLERNARDLKRIRTLLDREKLANLIYQHIFPHPGSGPKLNSYELADKLRSSLLGSGPEGEER